MELFKSLAEIKSIQGAIFQLQALHTLTTKIHKAIIDAKEFHKDQKRKSGIPYVIHPLCVACIVSYYGGDEAMICASLLHDVVEDTLCEIDYIYKEYGDEVGNLVDALTKIVEIRNEELPSFTTSDKLAAHALSFRKMLLASIKDPKVLMIKISDRMHNMLTLDVLHAKKQIRISEETLVVYAPIAHRLGISSLKNELEDKSFYYIFPDEYNKIQKFMKQERQNLELKLHHFTHKISTLLLNEGFLQDDFEIQSRVKRPYSIYLKMQRKGISIDEMLDLLAIRIILKDSIHCYKALGIIHLNLKPIPSRLKDYISLPKENGYQTIHTTVFDESSVFEVQIRTLDMHKSAEFGFAAHWKYKSSGINPDMSWLQNMQYGDNDIEEFYELARNDLYREDIVVFSPLGDTFNLPSGAVALDFAYAVHSELGNYAKEVYVNHQKTSLLQRLKSSDIVKIVAGDKIKTRCSWIESVKTSKAKSHMRAICQSKVKEIDKKSALNILSTIFNKNHSLFEEFIKTNNLEEKISKICYDTVFLKDIKNQIKEAYKIDTGIFSVMKFGSLKLRPTQFDNFLLYTNRNINDVTFDYCCRPKYGDSIVALKYMQKIVVHHKLCDKANDEINNKVSQIFIKWAQNTKLIYKAIVSLQDRKGSLSAFLAYLAKCQCNVLSFNYDGYKNVSSLCDVLFETDNGDTKMLREVISKKYKLIEFSNVKDAYQN